MHALLGTTTLLRIVVITSIRAGTPTTSLIQVISDPVATIVES